MEQVHAWHSFGGVQRVWSHPSAALDCQMEFALYEPPQAAHSNEALPLLIFLSGLTCRWNNFVEKAGSQRLAAQLGCYVLVPDTSPRGDKVADCPDEYDLGQGASFYLDATQKPWQSHYQMQSYISEELFGIIERALPGIDLNRVGILGHSMGGHGALVTALRHPKRFKSVSALAPISNPMNCPWGQKAFKNYLGPDEKEWQSWDASKLLAANGWQGDILIDQGSADQFYLDGQLLPESLQEAAKLSQTTLRLRIHEGYDHSYYFVASFLDDHFKFHYRHFI